MQDQGSWGPPRWPGQAWEPPEHHGSGSCQQSQRNQEQDKATCTSHGAAPKALHSRVGSALMLGDLGSPLSPCTMSLYWGEGGCR